MNCNFAFPPRFSNHLDVLSEFKLKEILVRVLPDLKQDKELTLQLSSNLWDFGIRYVSDFRFVEYRDLVRFGMPDSNIIVFAAWVRGLRRHVCHTCGKIGTV